MRGDRITVKKGYTSTIHQNWVPSYFLFLSLEPWTKMLDLVEIIIYGVIQGCNYLLSLHRSRIQSMLRWNILPTWNLLLLIYYDLTDLKNTQRNDVYTVYILISIETIYTLSISWSFVIVSNCFALLSQTIYFMWPIYPHHITLLQIDNRVL